VAAAGGLEVKQLFKTSIFQAARWSGLTPTIGRILSGRAVILMFHEVQLSHRSELKTGASVALLEYLIGWLRRRGWEIVSLETCIKRLTTEPRAGRYAVLTFDDGYRDNYSVALPILERSNTPFMVYVPTGAPTRTLNAWWLGLREIFRSRDTVAIDPMGVRFRCPDFHNKTLALHKVSEWIHADYRRIAMLDSTFERAGLSLSALNDRYFLNESELQVLARHPLASIGGHTTSHPALASLDHLSARTEMADNRNYLENLLQVPVRHIAYPYGNSRACGPREQRLAKEVGFSTAVTTRQEHVFDREQNYFALPRLAVGGPFETIPAFEARMARIQSVVKGMLGNT
jgi:peptidoglycan/xylan/chitin deacetylase (PgdA/CDA1 family)